MQQRPVYAAPSLMSVRSCFVTSNVQPQLPYPYAHASQPHLSHSFSQPFISKAYNSADHLVSTSLNQLNKNNQAAAVQPQQALVEDGTLPFHEQVKNSAAYKLQQKNSVTVCSDSDVNVIGTAVRIQVRLFFRKLQISDLFPK